MRNCLEQLALCRKYLDAVVAIISDVDSALRVAGDAFGKLQMFRVVAWLVLLAEEYFGRLGQIRLHAIDDMIGHLLAISKHVAPCLLARGDECSGPARPGRLR